MPTPNASTSSTPTPSTKKPSLPPPVKRAPGGGAATSRGSWRKTLFRLHGWIGLNVGLLLFVICLSGSVATLSHEIDQLLDPAHRVAEAPPPGTPLDWTAMHEAVAAAFPEGRNLGVYAPGSNYAPPDDALGRGAAVAYVALPDGQTRKVYLNPYTGAVQGHTSFFNVQRFFRSFHRRFFDGVRGILVVTLAGLPLLAAALTGLLFYKGWLKQLVTLRTGKGPRILWSDLHKGAGIWGLLFTFLIALTGLFYFVELGFQAADNYGALLPEPLPRVDAASLDTLGPQPEPLPTGAYVAAAERALPGLRVRSVRMPHAPGEAVYVDGQRGNPLTRDRANKVHLHPFTGAVLGVQRSADLGAVPFVTDAADPLHFGYVGGLWTKALWCLLGLLLSFSILSGTYLWVVRSGPVRAPEASAGGLRPFPMLRGALVATALTLAYFGVVTFAVVDGIQGYGPERGPDAGVAEVKAGPYRVAVTCQVPCRPSEGATLVARFRGDGLPNVRRTTLGPADATDGVEMEGTARRPTATVEAAPGTPLALRLVARDGQAYEARFAAPAPVEATAPLPTWPDTAPGVWWVVGGFVVLAVASILAWLWMVARAFRAKQAKLRRVASA